MLAVVYKEVWFTWAFPGEVRDRLQVFNRTITHWCAKWRISLANNKTQIIGSAKTKKHETHTISQTNKLTLQIHFKIQLSKLDAAVRLFNTIDGTSIGTSQTLNLNILRTCITSLWRYAPTITLLWKDLVRTNRLQSPSSGAESHTCTPGYT